MLPACGRGPGAPGFGRATLFLQLIVHVLLGFRDLHDSRAYRDDPMVRRVLGLEHLPDVSTLSRMLKDADQRSVEHLRRLLRELLFERLAILGLARVTLDFDGSVLSTRRHAEGPAVGYNKKRKGERRYYPLFCTIAQTGQVFDFLHRSGNVHDSNGARTFILACIQAVREALPNAVVEARLDSAFFSDEIIAALDAWRVDFTVSVPFERFPERKAMIESRQRWQILNSEVSYFEAAWKPKCWEEHFHFVLVRTRSQQQPKGPVQLDLFIPHEYGYEFKVIVTNKTAQVDTVVAYHEGRGAQEGLFGDLKTYCQMGYIPVRTWVGNQLYLLAGLFAHNLAREFQMATTPPCRNTTVQRTALWAFEKLDTLRNTLLPRAGRLTRPQGVLTLTLNANAWLRQYMPRMLQTLQAIKPAA